MFRRRKHPSKWSRERWKQQIQGCYTSDPDQEEVKASVIVHWDLSILPKDTVEVAKREVAEAGEEWVGFREYATFLLGFNEDDRAEVFMDYNAAVCVRQRLQSTSLEEAKANAREWVGAGGLELPFENIPGLYQAAFFEFVTGKECDLGPALYMWALPAVGGTVPVRQFPPAVNK